MFADEIVNALSLHVCLFALRIVKVTVLRVPGPFQVRASNRQRVLTTMLLSSRGVCTCTSDYDWAPTAELS